MDERSLKNQTLSKVGNVSSKQQDLRSRADYKPELYFIG
jgi:hypothetical protein